MNEQTNLPPPLPPRRAIKYELTRGDVFANWMTVILRNRILQIFVVAALIINEWLLFARGFGTRSLGRMLVEAILYALGFFAFLAVIQCLMGFAHAFLLKHRGVVGEHVLEITEQGLIERTEYNETLHRWSSVRRVVSLGAYLYFYVSDTNSHQVPKRCFSSDELKAFAAEVRARTTR